MWKQLCLLIIVFAGNRLLSAQVPTLDQLEQATKKIQIQTEQQVQHLLHAYQTLQNAEQSEYDYQVDRIIRQLIQLKSDEAVNLCIKHIDSSWSFDFSVSSCPGNYYLNYLVSRGPSSLKAMLDYLKENNLTEQQRATHIWYAGMVMGYQNKRDRDAVLKCANDLLPGYGKAILDPVVARALVTPPPCSR